MTKFSALSAKFSTLGVLIPRTGTRKIPRIVFIFSVRSTFAARNGAPLNLVVCQFLASDSGASTTYSRYFVTVAEWAGSVRDVSVFG
jgi:hypothetical protein